MLSRRKKSAESAKKVQSAKKSADSAKKCGKKSAESAKKRSAKLVKKKCRVGFCAPLHGHLGVPFFIFLVIFIKKTVNQAPVPKSE
jgi:hypothetical protein